MAIYTVKEKRGDRGGEHRKCKLNENALYAEQSKTKYKHMQWSIHRPLETSADPVIAKCPGVMSNTVTQCQKMLQCDRCASRPR